MIDDHSSLKYLVVLFTSWIYLSCGQGGTVSPLNKDETDTDTLPVYTLEVNEDKVDTTASSIDYVGLTLLPQEFPRLIDLRYATKDNFVHAAIYSCSKCYVRDSLARRLNLAEQALLEKGYRLIYYDCYRPSPAQQRLWNILPNPTYVTNPSKGSMHSRALAVDVGLADLNGKELDMGSPFDHFGKISHMDTKDLSSAILERRQLLATTMKQHGLIGIRTEWWHYALRQSGYNLLDWEWECP